MSRNPAGPGRTSNGEGSRPLHMQIRAVLEDRVVSGSYAVGDLLPTEIELAREFETSRFTIREALRYLHERGYVERRQGVGTRVVGRSPRSAYTLSVRSLEELFQVAHGTTLQLLREEWLTLDADLAVLLGAGEGDEWLRLEGVRWTEPGGRPICYVQVHLPGRFATLAPQIREVQGPIFALVERHAASPIEKTVQEICAVPMPARMAPLVCGTPEAWALRIVRRYVACEEVILTSVNWHPAGDMTYVMEIRRASMSG